ncbi:hypothetical protein C1645_837247 [Glomus cerebriforme]|uniref:Uncharacterized protein n=1 Tax=Glomus cerebriforme TaxID=658196 RepID=A0A397S5L0_9GLOM|nr:hypothetical protein C1645_837247 [Glomus cerebriforme]
MYKANSKVPKLTNTLPTSYSKVKHSNKKKNKEFTPHIVIEFTVLFNIKQNDSLSKH